MGKGIRKEIWVIKEHNEKGSDDEKEEGAGGSTLGNNRIFLIIELHYKI